jgi:dipeptidase
VLIGKALTADGSVIHAHNEDMGNRAAGRVWTVGRSWHQGGTTMEVPYVELLQAPETLGYWAAGNAEGPAGLGTSETAGPYDSVLVGLNERGVSMSCNWAHSREENREGVGIRRYAIRQILLERATTARHGVEILGELIETHGQADWGGLIYHLADSREAWVVETTTRNWVGRRVRDDEIRVTANRFRVGADYDLSSKTLVADAVEAGWLAAAGDELDFSRVYGRPGKMDQAYDTRREDRVEALLAGRAGEIEPHDIFPILRDRYEGTVFYTPPQPGPVWREDLDGRPELSRTISTNLAQSTFVAHLRADLPVGVGSVMWFGLGTPSYAAYVPLYAGGSSIPRPFSESSLDEQADSAWGLFRRLQRGTDRDYESAYPAIRATLDARLAEALKASREAERTAIILLARGEAEAAAKVLSTHSFELAQDAIDLASRLLSP